MPQLKEHTLLLWVTSKCVRFQTRLTQNFQNILDKLPLGFDQWGSTSVERVEGLVQLPIEIIWLNHGRAIGEHLRAPMVKSDVDNLFSLGKILLNLIKSSDVQEIF